MVSKEFVENFSIAKIADYEACAPAIKFLFKRYGDEVTLLSNRRKDFMAIIDNDNRPDWIIYFLLSLLKPEHKIHFYELYFKESLLLLNDKKVVVKFKRIFNAYKKNKTELLEDHLAELTTILLNKNFAIENVNHSLMPTIDSQNLYYQKFLCESLFFLLDKESNPTNAISRALAKIAELQTINDLANSGNNIKLKSIAHRLIDYLEFFKD